MKAPKSLEENILYQIGELSKLFHKKISATFNENGFGVTVEQFSILALLWYREGVTQQDIANGLNRDKTTIARVVENMISNNLIVKVPDQLDRRNKRIYLTQKGKALQKEMVEASGAVYYQALKGIPDADIEHCLLILKQISNNLE
jgi:DNA-binding MarR family transcriptional regulator